MKPPQDTEDRQHHGAGCSACSRRQFMAAASAILVPDASARESKPGANRPGSRYTPKIQAVFVKGGDDAEAEAQACVSRLMDIARDLGVKIDLRPAGGDPDRPDGRLVVMFGSGESARREAAQALNGTVPSIVLAPGGVAPTPREGPLILPSGDRSQTRYALKLLAAGARLRETRYVIIQGGREDQREVEGIGAKLRYLPARRYLEEFNRAAPGQDTRMLADACCDEARSVAGPTRSEACEALRNYTAAHNILDREQGDGISMDCLGVFGRTRSNLPCLAWSRLLDHGIPASCGADPGAALTQTLVHLLFDRPGHQQEAPPEGSRDCPIGRQFACPTRLDGFEKAPERHDLTHHHDRRGIVPRAHWRAGRRVTGAGLLLAAGSRPRMVIHTGAVVDSGAIRLDAVTEAPGCSGVYRCFFYGDFKNALVHYCRLFGIQPITA